MPQHDKKFNSRSTTSITVEEQQWIKREFFNTSCQKKSLWEHKVLLKSKQIFHNCYIYWNEEFIIHLPLFCCIMPRFLTKSLMFCSVRLVRAGCSAFLHCWHSIIVASLALAIWSLKFLITATTSTGDHCCFFFLLGSGYIKKRFEFEQFVLFLCLTILLLLWLGTTTSFGFFGSAYMNYSALYHTFLCEIFNY